jgi:hypothetical protein
MIRDDPETSRSELRWVCEQLTNAGVPVAVLTPSDQDAGLINKGVELSPLRQLHSRDRQSDVSRRVLADSLGSLTTIGGLWAVVDALGRHELMDEHICLLASLAERLRGMSFDEYVQFLALRALRGLDPLVSKQQREQAELAIREGFYLSADPPSCERRLHVYDPAYPQNDDRLRFREDSLKGLVFNVLLWHARPSILEHIVHLATDASHGHTRFVLCEALRVSDPDRAAQHLIALIEDPDVGAYAMVELGRLRYAPARPLIENFLDHPIDWVRREAKKALRRLDQAAGRRAATPAPFDEVLPASERALGAKLVTGKDATPRDIEGKVSAFVIGSLAEDERGWTRENCCSTTIDLSELDSFLGKLRRKFKGDFRGTRASTLRDEILQAEHEDWKAYKLNVRIGERAEEIWFHYFLDDPSTVDVTIWGPADFITMLRGILSEG